METVKDSKFTEYLEGLHKAILLVKGCVVFISRHNIDQKPLTLKHRQDLFAYYDMC